VLWAHKRFNAVTHDNLSKFFGGTTMHALELLMGTHGYVTNNDHELLVTPGNLQGILIMFISGGANVVFTLESTDKSYTTITTMFRWKAYECQVFDGYSHLDCWMGSRLPRTSIYLCLPMPRRYIAVEP
jgi:hypothetical protein